MKSTVLSLMTLLALVACNKSSSSKSSSSSNPSTQPTTPDICVQYPTAYGCPDSTTGGGSTGTTSGSDGGPIYQDKSSIYKPLDPPSDNDWASYYPKGVPTPDAAYKCKAPTGEGYDLRRGTITMAGKTMFRPDHPWGSLGEEEYRSVNYTHNNSSFFVDPVEMAKFLDTDAKLRIRFKIHPQPKAPTGKSWCFNRVFPQSPNPAGYRNVSFSVSIQGLDENGNLKPALESTKYITGQANGCSPTVDFSGENQRHPHGFVIVVHNVKSDQGCWYNSASSTPRTCTAMEEIKSGACWSMDIEASVDGTKNI